MTEIGNKIKEIRKKKGFSQEVLAEFSKVNLRTIQRIENNQSQPRGKTLHLICEALNVNIEDVLDYGKTEDVNYLALFHLSVIAFLALPIGNIIIPFILWMNNKNKITKLNEIGKNLLNFQIIFTILQYVLLITYALMKITHTGSYRIFGYGFICIVLVNLILPILFVIKTKTRKNRRILSKHNSIYKIVNSYQFFNPTLNCIFVGSKKRKNNVEFIRKITSNKTTF